MLVVERGVLVDSDGMAMQRGWSGAHSSSCVWALVNVVGCWSLFVNRSGGGRLWVALGGGRHW